MSVIKFLTEDTHRPQRMADDGGSEIDEFAMFKARSLGVESEYLELARVNKKRRSIKGSIQKTTNIDNTNKTNINRDNEKKPLENKHGSLEEEAPMNDWNKKKLLDRMLCSDNINSEPMLNSTNDAVNYNDLNVNSSYPENDGLLDINYADLQRSFSYKSQRKPSKEGVFMERTETTSNTMIDNVASRLNRQRNLTMPHKGRPDRRSSRSKKGGYYNNIRNSCYNKASFEKSDLRTAEDRKASLAVGLQKNVLNQLCADKSLLRVRNFSTKDGNIINRGDSIKIRRHPNKPNHTADPPLSHSKPSIMDNKKTYGSFKSNNDQNNNNFHGSKSKKTAICLDKDSNENNLNSTSQNSSNFVHKAVRENTPEKNKNASSTSHPTNNFMRHHTKNFEEKNSLENETGVSDGDRIKEKRPQVEGEDAIKKTDNCISDNNLLENKIRYQDDDVVYKVVVMGMTGVGKSTLTQQILTSEYLANNENDLVDESAEKTVSVQIDGEESLLQFVDMPSTSQPMSWKRKEGMQPPAVFPKADAHLVVYSVTDKNSYLHAQACLQDLRPAKRHNAVILVANKQDLVRNRVIQEEDGKNLAHKKHCKFIEVSALLDHKIDDLLVGTTRQIRLRKPERVRIKEDDSYEEIGCLQKAVADLYNRIVRRRPLSQTSSCDDLFKP